MNKIEMVIFGFTILLFVMGSASSVTRKISASSDNIYTMIRNSNGKYWDAISSNIQKAINDLNNKSGIVWLPGNKTFYLIETVVIWKDITLDMGGCEFRLPNGINTNVVELKDGAGIQNGVIDVSGHQARYKTGYDRYTSNTSFTIPNACIFLNASSQIHSAHIENMALDSISDGYQSIWQSPPVYYSSNYLGRGYGIHLYASNVDIPQFIYNVTVDSLYTRDFNTAIFIHNERHPIGNQNSAHIDGNTFERLFAQGDSYYINISRDTSVDEKKCSTSGNVFNLLQYQVGRSSYWGGDELSWRLLTTDGYGNIFKNFMGWDHNFLHGDGNWIILNSDSNHCYMNGRCFLTTFDEIHCIDNGQNNTRFDNGDSVLVIDSFIMKE